MIKRFLHKLRYSKGHGGVLARGAIGVFIVKVAGAGLLFALHVMLARLLGAEQYGIYVYAWTWIHILAILCLLGFQTSLVRFIAEYNIKQQWALLRGILRKSDQFVLGFSILVSIIGASVVSRLRDDISNELAVTFYIAFCLLPVFAFTRLRESSLRALKHAVQSELLLRIIRPVLMGTAVIGLYFRAGDDLTAKYAMSANLAAVIIAAVTGTVLLHRLLPKSVGQTKPEFANNQWLKVSFPLLLITSMNLLLKRTDIVMLGIFRGSETAGIYSAASKVSDLVVFGLIATNTMLTPMISELFHTGKKNALQKTIIASTKAIFIFTAVISIILVILGKYMLFLFGTEFITAYIPLLILLIGQNANALAGPAVPIMSMTGHQMASGVIITICTGINLLLNIIFIQKWGSYGAAIATTATLIVWNLTMIVYIKQKINILPTFISGRQTYV